MNYYEAKEQARQMRLKPTPSETILWQYLRKRQLDNKKFLRQHPIFVRVINGESFYFIPDFFCYEESLAIELDGEIHQFRTEIDAKRDTILTDMGIKVLRFQNSELTNIDAILKKIQLEFKSDKSQIVKT